MAAPGTAAAVLPPVTMVCKEAEQRRINSWLRLRRRPPSGARTAAYREGGRLY